MQKETIEYMSVGELARKMNTTVRTLQYYDSEGILKPSAFSESGRRLYTYKDMIVLHQILSFKSLGFSLDEIKNHLIALDNPKDFANALTQQAAAIQKQITQLQNAWQSIEALKNEVLSMHQVDFKKYADIIVNLQMNNEYYWVIKHLDDDLLDHIRSRFDQDSGIAFIRQFNDLNHQLLAFQENHVEPQHEKVQQVVKTYWDMILQFSEGDMSLLPKLIEFANTADFEHEGFVKQTLIHDYLEKALEIYFKQAGINPFSGESHE